MFRALSAFAENIAQCYSRYRENRRLMAAVLNTLDRKLIRAGEEFGTIRSAIGPTNGLGVEILGIRSQAIWRIIPQVLVQTGLNIPLLYRSAKTRSVFCGEYSSDRAKFTRRADSLSAQLRHEGTPEPLLQSPRDARIEDNVRGVLSELGFWDADCLTETDLEGTCVTVLNLPDEAAAHTTHRALISVLDDFPLSARFVHEERWNVFFDDHASKTS